MWGGTSLKYIMQSCSNTQNKTKTWSPQKCHAILKKFNGYVVGKCENSERTFDPAATKTD